MIKGLQGISGLTVSGGNTSVPYINQNHSNPIQGMIRIWGSDMQVFDGNAWINMSTSYATVGLDQDVLDIVQWARKKRDEDLSWKLLAEKNSAVKIALDNLEQAKEQLRITAHLAKEEYETTS
jgi:hypothetical protein